jgi:hypothetical protein
MNHQNVESPKWTSYWSHFIILWVVFNGITSQPSRSHDITSPVAVTAFAFVQSQSCIIHRLPSEVVTINNPRLQALPDHARDFSMVGMPFFWRRKKPKQQRPESLTAGAGDVVPNEGTTTQELVGPESDNGVIPRPTTVQALFDGEGLRQPPVPAHLVSKLRQQKKVAPTVFATQRRLSESPYDIRYHVHEFESKLAATANPDRMPEYAVVGIDGHGMNSWATHYYIVSAGLALFLQLPWGGAFSDANEDRALIAEMYEWADQVQTKLAAVHQQQRRPKLWLQVVASRFYLYDSGWRWLEVGTDCPAVPWNDAGGMKAAILADLDHLLST